MLMNDKYSISHKSFMFDTQMFAAKYMPINCEVAVTNLLWHIYDNNM